MEPKPLKFKKGDRVRPLTEGIPTLKTTKHDRRDEIGTVSHYDHSNWVWVEFSDGFRESYGENGLEKV